MSNHSLSATEESDPKDGVFREQQKIALPDAAECEALPNDLRAAYESGMLINVYRALLRSPTIAEHAIRLGAAQFATGALPAIDRELVILACGLLYQAPYETAQHEPISRAVGVSDDQRAAIAAESWSAEVFTTAQRALLRFAAQAARSPHVGADQLADIRAHYDDQQVVETVVLVGYYFLIARITTVLDVPIDAPTDDRVLRAGQALFDQERRRDELDSP